MAAKGVVVIFSDAYRANFSKALQQEAGVILQLYRTPHTRPFKIFVLDPALYSAADLRANIEDKTPGMGNIQAWIQFVTPFLEEEDAVDNLI